MRRKIITILFSGLIFFSGFFAPQINSSTPVTVDKTPGEPPPVRPDAISDFDPGPVFGSSGALSQTWMPGSTHGSGLTGDNSFPSGAFFANVIVVTREDDPDNTTGSCGSGGACSLRQAVNLSNNSSGDEIIQFSSGVRTVRFSLTVDGPGNPHTDVVIRLNGSLFIQGPGSGQLTITRQAGVSGRIFTVEKDTSNVFSLSGVTVSGGNGVGKPHEDYPGFGGAILTTDTALSLNDVALQNNSVQNKGGALALVWGRSDSDSTSTLNIDITNSYISNNTGGVGCGGIVTLVRLANIGQQNTMLGGTLNITNSAIDQNTATGGNGGGICANFQFTNITNSQITRNSSGNDGGGIDVGSPDTNARGTLTVRNSTISTNRSTGGGTGGGINSFRDNVILESSTIAFNETLANFAPGGGLYKDSGQATIHNSIIAKNLDGSHNCPDVCGTIQSNGYNILGSAGSSLAIVLDGPGDLIGGRLGQAQVDPLLNSLNANGGTTLNHSLACGSPAVNAGDPAIFLSTDQRGVPRPQGSRADMGAYESFECFPTVHNNNDSGPNSLRDVINRSSDGRTIYFSPSFFNQPRLIRLTSGELSINKNLTIDGGTANSVTISGSSQSRIFNIGSGVTVNLNRFTLTEGNSSTGGAVYNNGTLNLTNSLITGNQANDGGGITNARLMTISNSTISNNFAPNGKGGGIINTAPSNVSLTTTNVTIARNRAASGGGVFNESGTSSVFFARNTIFAENTGTTRGPDFDGSLNSLGYNLISNTDWTGISGDATGNKLNISPKLGPLGDYGGPTKTHVLSCVSPAVDSGDPNNVLSTDQRGAARPFQGRADMGAYELSGPCSLTLNSHDESSVFSLRREIADIHYGGVIRSAVSDITITGGEIVIDKDLTIDGSRTNLLMISAANLSRIFNITNGAVVNLLQLRLINGNSSGGNGGAVLVNQGTTLNAAAFAVQSSTAGSGSGGAVYNAGTLSLTNALLSGSSAAFGGGLANDGTATINNSTIAGNTATDSSPGTDNKGGGIYTNAVNNSVVNTTNVTISGNNSASYGGGIYVELGAAGSGYNLRNTIITGNTAGQGCPDVSAMSGMYSFGYNLIGAYGSAYCNQWDNLSPTLAGNVLNPAGGARLAPLGDYGGPTQTFALLLDSPALDAGDPNNVVGASDQRNSIVANPCAFGGGGGSQRLLDGNVDGTVRVDIGAFERNITFDQTSLPHVRRAETYNQTITARFQPCGAVVRGDVEVVDAYTIVPAGGQGLPPGIALAANGKLSGVPTLPGTYTFTVKALNYLDRTAGAQEFTIVVDEGTSFSIDDVTHDEGNSGASAYIFTVTKTGPDAASVGFTTVDDTATVADNDYQFSSGTLNFNANDTTKQITIFVNGDTKYDRNETFKVHLTANGSAFLTRADGTGTILNDDCVEPPAGLVAWYPVENNLSDIVGNQTGTQRDAIAYVPDGKIGSAAHFSGTTLAANPNGRQEAFSIPRPIQDDFTISFWLRSTAAIFSSQAAWFQAAGVVTGDEFGVSYAQGRILFGTPGGTIRTPGGYNNGSWHHVAVTRVRSTGLSTIYVDGNRMTDAFLNPNQSLNASQVLVIGSLTGNNNHFRGDLDEIQFFNRALDEADVADIFIAGAGNRGACHSSTLEFSSPTYNVAENGNASITVTRSGVRDTPAAVNYATVAGGTAAGGTICPGVDYINTSGTLNFAAGEASKTFNVTFCDDNVFEANETINLALTNAIGDNILLGSPASAVLIIRNDDPTPPTDIALTNNSVPENSASGTTVGAFSTTDPNPEDTFTYTLESGTGGGDNALFTIAGNELKTNTLLDFETKNIYHIRVRTTDQSTLFFEKEFTVSIANVNEAPINLALSKSSIPENNAVNAVLGAFSTTDQDADNSYTYTLVPGIGDTGNPSFVIGGANGDELRAAVSFDFETKPIYSILVRTTDQGGLFFEKQFNITIINVNEAPTLNVINNPAAISEDAGQQTINLSGISAGPANESSQILTITAVSNNPELISNPVVSYTNPGETGSLIYTPAADANGQAVITVTLKDNGGMDNNGVDVFRRTFTVNVSEVNDAPVAVNDILMSVNEDSGTRMIPFSDLTTNDGKGAANEGSQSLIVKTAGGAVGGTVTLDTANSRVLFTPDANFNGTASFTYTIEDNGTTNGVNDPKTSAGAAIVSFDVTAINDAPTLDSITIPGPILEDASQQTINLGGITAGGGETQTLTVTAASDNTSLVSNPTVNYTSPDTAGTLTLTPVTNANGSATITVTVMDNGGVANNGVNSFQRTFTINVTAVNDAPSFTRGLDQTVNEDAGAQIVNGWAMNISAGPADEAGQTLTFNVTTNNNALFSAAPVINPANGNLTYTPAANANGTATVTVTLSDNGGTANNGLNTSAPQTFVITVNAVNDAPTLDAITNPAAIAEDSTQQTVNLAGITAGPANENTQILTVTATSDNPGLIPNPTVGYTSPSTTGTLNYTPVANANGKAVITVTVKDNGGTGNNGSDTFTRTFTVTVWEVNDAPAAVNDTLTDVAEDSGQRIIPFADLTTNDSKGPANESTQTLIVKTAGSAIGGTVMLDSANNRVLFTPAVNYNGPASFTYTIEDNGTTNGANDSKTSAAAATVSFNVTAVNDAPTLDAIMTPQTILEDADTVTVNLTGITAGPADESLQTLIVTASSDNTILIPNPVVNYTSPNAIGALTFKPVANRNGTAIITVTVTDNGATGGANVNTFQRTFTVNVTAVNDAPALDPIPNPAPILRNAGQQMVNLTGITAGDGETQTLTVTAVSNNPGLIPNPIVNYTSPNATGSLNYTPVPNQSGTAVITVTVTDDGGAANNGVNSVSRSFTVEVIALADLSVTETDSPDPVIPGNNIAYTINVMNGGPASAATVELINVIPANTTYQMIYAPAGWTCTTPAVNGTGTVSCTNPLLANGASASFTLIVNVNTGATTGTIITNTTGISTTNPDPNIANNTVSTATTVAEYTSPQSSGLVPKAVLVKPVAGNTTAGGGSSDTTCTAPSGVTLAGTFANINQALGAANVGDAIYVCPKYNGSLVTPYIEQISLGFTNLSVVGITDSRGSRAVIAANPSTPTTSTTQMGTNYIVQIVATGVNFGNFVIDGAPAGTNFAGTGIFNGIVIRRSGAFIFNNTVQNIRTADADVNSNGQGIATFGAGSPLEAGTIASPVNVLNNVVQNFRSNGINVSAGSSSAYAFVRGNYIIGNGSNPGTINQSGVQFLTGANGDIFNNRITNILNNNASACTAAAFNNCSAGIRLDTTAGTSANSLRVRFNTMSKIQTGIFGLDVQYLNIASNTITGSEIDGIHLQGSTFNLGSNFNLITANQIFSSRRSGIFIGQPGGDASLGNNINTNVIEDSYFGVEDFTAAGNNTIQLTGVTANTFINVNRIIGNDGAANGGTTNQLP